jgi:hypothetical protein
MCLTSDETLFGGVMDSSLHEIHQWIGCGAKLNLSKSPDADILKAIILKLQKRVEQGQQLC